MTAELPSNPSRDIIAKSAALCRSRTAKPTLITFSYEPDDRAIYLAIRALLQADHREVRKRRSRSAAA